MQALRTLAVTGLVLAFAAVAAVHGAGNDSFKPKRIKGTRAAPATDFRLAGKLKESTLSATVTLSGDRGDAGKVSAGRG